ncbi:unnamed protein product, partial [Mycena citricolor]
GGSCNRGSGYNFFYSASTITALLFLLLFLLPLILLPLAFVRRLTSRLEVGILLVAGCRNVTGLVAMSAAGGKGRNGGNLRVRRRVEVLDLDIPYDAVLDIDWVQRSDRTIGQVRGDKTSAGSGQ